jgi:hypothetical protein
VTVESDCACDSRAPCGFHFSQLPPNEKIALRQRLGIGGHVTTFDDPTRTRDNAHDTDEKRRHREAVSAGQVGARG